PEILSTEGLNEFQVAQLSLLTSRFLTFVNETASGWQQQRLNTPLAIMAGTQYVVTVSTSNSFSATSCNATGRPWAPNSTASFISRWVKLTIGTSCDGNGFDQSFCCARDETRSAN